MNTTPLDFDGVVSGVYQKNEQPAAGWGVVCATDRDQLTDIPLVDGAVVGSGPEASVRVNDASVSPLHARFSVRADAVYVEEVGNTTGVWVDGVRAERMEVAHGNVLRVGALLGIFVERDLLSYCGKFGRAGELVHGPRQKSWVERACAHAAARESFLIEGSAGVGKAALAQAAVQSAKNHDGVTIVDARSATANGAVCDALALRPSILVILHIEHLERVAQVEAVRVIKRTPGIVLIGTLGRTMEQALSDGLLAPAVASVVGSRRVMVPSLDARREDIPAILHAACESNGLPHEQLTVGLLEQFMRGGWPGGVRQMREVLRDAFEKAKTEPGRIAVVRERVARAGMKLPLPLQQADPSLARVKLQRALDRAGGTIAAAARELRVSRQAFYREVKRLQVELPKKKSREPSADQL